MVPDIKDLLNIFPVLETSRLKLVQVTEEHSDDLFELLGNKNVMKYLYFNYETRKDAADSIPVFDEWYNEKSGIRWGITMKDNPKLIGTIYITFFKPGASGNFGYDLNEDYWNKGISTEAANAVCDFAFTTLGLKQLEARVGVENPASQRVLEKAGFAHVRILEDKEEFEGKSYEQILYLRKPENQ